MRAGQLLQTYSIRSPRSTHTRAATCEEIGCRAFTVGWTTRVPTGSSFEGTVRACGRRWSACVTDGAETVFTFAPGTECFRSSTHRVPLDRPEIYIVRAGMEPGRRHTRAADWAEDLAEHLARVEKDRS